MYIDLCMPFVINNLKYIRIFRHALRDAFVNIAQGAATRSKQSSIIRFKGNSGLKVLTQQTIRQCSDTIQTVTDSILSDDVTVDPMQGRTYCLVCDKKRVNLNDQKNKQQSLVVRVPEDVYGWSYQKLDTVLNDGFKEHKVRTHQRLKTNFDSIVQSIALYIHHRSVYQEAKTQTKR